MDKVAKELTNVSLATSLSTGLHSAAFMEERIDSATTSEARQASAEVLVDMMGDEGVIALDPELAIRAFEVLSRHEIALIEAKRKLVETQMEVLKTLSSIEESNNNVSDEGANTLEEKDTVKDPLDNMGNSLFPGA